MIVAADIHLADFAQHPGLDDVLLRVDQMGRALALRADLHHAAILAGGGHHRFAFEHVAADRLLAVDVGPGFDGRDHRQRMPMVGRADQHDVEILLLEHLAIVAICPRRFLRFLPVRDQFDRAGQHLLIDVAQRDHFDRRDLNQPAQIALAIPTAADQADAIGLLLGRPSHVRPSSDAATPAAPVFSKSRRFIPILPEETKR